MSGGRSPYEDDELAAWDEAKTVSWREPTSAQRADADRPAPRCAAARRARRRGGHDRDGGNDGPLARMIARARAALAQSRATVAVAIVAGCVALASVLVGAVGVAHLRAAPAVEPGSTETVVPVALVGAAPPTRAGRFFGTTRAIERANLAFTVGGRLTERAVAVGDAVHAGQVVARVDAAASADNAVAAAAAQGELGARVAIAERERARLERLVAEGAVAERELDQARAQARALRASQRAAAARARATGHVADEGALVAPFDGIVTAVRGEVGEVVAPGTPVIVLSSGGPVEVELLLPETAVSDVLSIGLEIPVAFPVLGERAPVTGKVTRVARTTSTGLYPVVVELPPGVPAGVTAEATVPIPTRAPLAVPVEAMVDPVGRRPRVIVVREGRAHFVDVRPYELVDGQVVVGGALALRDLVVVGRHRLVLPEDRVRPILDGSVR